MIKNTDKKKTKDWGDVLVQGGENGIVGTPTGTYRTAFVEAFPENPKTFIRGEGDTIEEAELSAWEQYQKILSCEEHKFERRGYKNGAGFCKKCDLFKSKVFQPSEICEICSTPTYYTCDIDDKWYCEEHSDMIPEEKRTELFKMFKKIIKRSSVNDGEGDI